MEKGDVLVFKAGEESSQTGCCWAPPKAENELQWYQPHVCYIENPLSFRVSGDMGFFFQALCEAKASEARP